MKKSLKALLIVFSIFASSTLIGSSEPAAAAVGAGALKAPQSSSDTKNYNMRVMY